VEALDNTAEFLNGLALQKYPAKNELDILPVIKIAQLRAGNTLNADICANSIPSQYIIENGDVLFSWSGSLEVEIWCGGRGALNQHLFKVTSSKYPKWFYYLWTKHYLEHFRFIAADKATTMGHIQRKHLNDVHVLIPSTSLFEFMSSQFDSLLQQFINLHLENNTLTALRDTLLPKLLSGEVEV
jgi:type I restriction enzyme S subunit